MKFNNYYEARIFRRLQSTLSFKTVLTFCITEIAEGAACISQKARESEKKKEKNKKKEKHAVIILTSRRADAKKIKVFLHRGLLQYI